MLVIFLGIAAAFQLSIDVVLNNKARAGAIEIANERMEYVRSLSYSSIGTSGGIPSGSVPQTESVSQNGISYTRQTFIVYVDDPKDGTGASDTFPSGAPSTADYKQIRVEVDWSVHGATRSITLLGRISPPGGMESSVSGGTLAISVVNASSQPVSGATVEVSNSSTSPTIDVTGFTNASGTITFIGAPASSNYQVNVSKTSYSSAQTYPPTSTNTNPSPARLTVSNGQTTSSTFAIDLLSSLFIHTYATSSSEWSDTFASDVKIGNDTSNIEVSGNQARLAGNQPFTQPGDLRSLVISPSGVERWKTFSWNDTRPSQTTITYHVYYPSNGSNVLVPDSALPGNSAGFTGTSVDLSSIPASDYPSLVLEAYLVALNPNAPAPSVQDWKVGYDNGSVAPFSFNLRGAKTIGSGPSGTIYKYDSTISSDSAGTISLTNMEWDTYTISIPASSGYDLASSCEQQPIVLSPNTAKTVSVFFSPHTSNSLIVGVKSASGAAIPSASVHLTKGGSYDSTVVADACGQAFFSGLTNGNYSISVTASGYQNYSQNSVNVTGQTSLTTVLN